MAIYRFFLLIGLILITYGYSIAQSRNNFRIVFYNVENYFDYKDDPETKDEEFLPKGKRHWDKYKYHKKRDKIAQVLIAAGGGKLPPVVGLCEIENRNVLEDLINYSPLKNQGYKIIHKESPDKRGIDVGVIYRPKKFTPLSYQAIPIHFTDNTKRATRDILYVKGKVKQDTLHLFFNHWPSRWGGQLESEPKRVFVAKVLRHAIDSLFDVHENPKIVIMGDFNDYPKNKSLSKVLKAQQKKGEAFSEQLYNLSYHFVNEKSPGTHKYRGKWGALDQIIVSGAILNAKNGCQSTIDNAHIFYFEKLLEKDESYIGYKPFRTFTGYKYNGGYSDHLPVFIDIFCTTSF